MATTSTLKQRAQSEVLYNPSNGYITPLGIEFPDGTVMNTTRVISISQLDFPSGVTSGMGTSGVGGYYPSQKSFASPILGPTVNIEYQLLVSGTTNTNITPGQTPTLNITGTAYFSDGSDETLNDKIIPITSILSTSLPAAVSLSQPLYFGTEKALTAFEIQFELFGPAAGSTNVVEIGACTIDVYSNQQGY